jgi:NADPH2:quinone reductase
VYISGTAIHKAYGAYAQYAVCTLDQIHRLPDRISFTQGAGLFVPYVTAWRALFGRAHTRAGDVVMIHGASGGVGSAATQFAVSVGATVVGTAGSENGLDLVRKQGAKFAVSHKAPNYLEEITRVTGGRGPDVILEMLANVNLDNDLTVVAPGGRIVVIGNRGRIEIDPRKIMTKDISVFGLALWGIPQDEIRRAHEAIVAGLDSGALNPVVGTEMPLRDAAKAHVKVMEPGATGKIVLIPDP